MIFPFRAPILDFYTARTRAPASAPMPVVVIGAIEVVAQARALDVAAQERVLDVVAQ